MKGSVFCGISVDGFLARPNGALNFLDHGGQEPHGYEEFMSTVDALVIGRNTYEIVRAFDMWPYGEKPVFVLSTHDLEPPPPGALLEHMSVSRRRSLPGLTLAESNTLTLTAASPFRDFFERVSSND
jgi:dihydrofolate reductase